MTRSALVTGASSGIGAAITARLLDDGWTVYGLCRSAPAPHPRLVHIAADISDPVGLDAVLQGLTRDHGPMRGIVHAAGVLRVGRLPDLDPDVGRQMWTLHVDAAAQIVNHLVRTMPDQGRIVLIGSRTAAGAAGRSQYAATKAALVGMARSWASELAPRGITVNVIAPGATDTPMLRDPARGSVAPIMPPLGRFVRPEEIGALAAFIMSDMAASLTGQQIVVCGGASL